VVLSALDMVAAVAAAFTFAIALVMAILIFDAFTAEGVFTGQEQVLFDQAKSAALTLDALTVVVVVGICLSSVILAFLIRSHPAFFIVSFIITLMLIPLTAMIGNIYEEFANDPALAAAANQLPLTYYVFEYLPKIAVVFSALIAVVMYSKGGA